jgi:hypothetical protein
MRRVKLFVLNQTISFNVSGYSRGFKEELKQEYGTPESVMLCYRLKKDCPRKLRKSLTRMELYIDDKQND